MISAVLCLITKEEGALMLVCLLVMMSTWRDGVICKMEIGYGKMLLYLRSWGGAQKFGLMKTHNSGTHRKGSINGITCMYKQGNPVLHMTIANQIDNGRFTSQSF